MFGVTKNSAGVTEIYRTSAINGHISSYILALKTNTRYKINVEISGTNFEESYRYFMNGFQDYYASDG